MASFILWLCVLFGAPLSGMAQKTDSDDGERSIKGRVFDENREPMTGVLVLVKGTRDDQKVKSLKSKAAYAKVK